MRMRTLGVTRSVALPSEGTRGLDDAGLRQAHMRFARLQVEAYDATATHGWCLRVAGRGQV